jgi:hypothetical protein
VENAKNKLKKIGSLTALKLGLGIGTIFLVATMSFFILLANGLLGIIGEHSHISYNNLYISFILLYLSFPVALWFFGSRISTNLNNGVGNTLSSAKFSFGVNFLIWAVFLSSQIILCEETKHLTWTVITLLFVISVGTITTFTLGLLITNRIKNKINSQT